MDITIYPSLELGRSTLYSDAPLNYVALRERSQAKWICIYLTPELFFVSGLPSGKTTLLQSWIAAGTVKRSEVVSSDDFRELVGDLRFLDWKGRPRDEANSLINHYQELSREAFQTMDAVVETRCRLNKLTIIDATHLHPDDRERYRQLAKKHHLPILSLVFYMDEQTLLDRDINREEPRGKKAH